MKRKNMTGKYKIAIMFASGTVLGILISASIGIGALHMSQSKEKEVAEAKEAETLEALKEDPLWILSEENVPLAAGATDSQAQALSGYIYANDEIQIAVDCPADQILAKLGEPISKQEASNSLYGNLDKHYQYDGFEVSTYELGETDYISAIFVDDARSTTPEGVSVSMTKDDMEEAYGMEYVEEDGICTYEKDGMGLEFMIDDGEITYIQYLSSNYM